jgi:DNA-binding transcriptional LysR family regulator
MDVDVAKVRAFVAVADEGHFGRAATALSITQQALSKRISRLESELGTVLLTRGPAGAALTEAGRRFLEPARRLLAAADTAVAAVTAVHRPLRIGVFGHLFQPLRTVKTALAHTDGLPVELGPERDLPAIAAALRRGDIDAGFGRVHGGEELTSAGLAHRLVRLEPVDAILGGGHRLACHTELRPADLADSTLMFPAAGERLDFLTRFADRFGITRRAYGTNAGLADFTARVLADPSAFSLLPADLLAGDLLPGDLPARVRTVPLTGPVPLYAWSLIWRRADHHHGLPRLRDAFATAGRESRWLEYRPEADWLPEGFTPRQQ